MQSAFAKREFARMEARAKIEEDLFTRVPLSKVERRRQKATTRSVNSLSQVGDFGDDVADLVDVAEELENKKRTRLVDSVTQLGAKPKKANTTSGDADLPMRDSLGVSAATQTKSIVSASRARFPTLVSRISEASMTFTRCGYLASLKMLQQTSRPRRRARARLDPGSDPGPVAFFTFTAPRHPREK